MPRLKQTELANLEPVNNALPDEHGYVYVGEAELQLSQAISLKRIADVLSEQLVYNPSAYNLFDRIGK